MDANTNQIELSGSISSVIYQNEENGYTVLRMDVDDGSQTTVIGCIPFAAPGEMLTVTGSWVTHPAHGQQFKADFVERTMPESAEAIYEYLAGHTVKGIGPATASMLVSRFGKDTLNVLEYHPEKLCEIKGISLSKAKEMSAHFHRQAGLRRLIEFLAAASIRPVVAMRMYQFYGDKSLELVQENPYILASDAIGATFAEADALALGQGFDGDSAERIAAAILFELSYNSRNGHCFIPRAKLIAATAQLIAVEEPLVGESLDMLLDSGEVLCEPVANVEACYLARLYEDECYTAERLLAMAEEEYRYAPDTEQITAQIEAQLGIRFAAQQKQTLELACRHQLIAITGGPGTGKTTSIRAILALFDTLQLDTQLAAPTGRAAKRMSELTGRSAQTIPRRGRAVGVRRRDSGRVLHGGHLAHERAAARAAAGLPADPRGRCRPAPVRRAGERLCGYHPQRRGAHRSADGDLPPVRGQQHRGIRARHQPRGAPASFPQSGRFLLPAPQRRCAHGGDHRGAV